MRILDVDAAAGSDVRALTPHLLEEEDVLAAYVSPSGSALFTSTRILLVAREHLLEARVETSSYPYREVRRFSIQEGEDGRSAVRIWLGDEDHPLHLRARPGTDLTLLQRLLASRLG